MDKLSLAALLDEDREMTLANIAADRSLPATQAALEKAIDRVMYRFVERCDDAALRDSAQYILQTMKNALPLIDAVGDVRAWKKEYDSGQARGRVKPLALAALLAGLVLTLASAMAVLIEGRFGGLLAFVKALLPALLGAGCLFWAGLMTGRPEKKQSDASPGAVRMEYLSDPDKAWHCLRGAMLQADGQLDRLREENAARDARARADAPAGSVEPGQLELFAQLLESAYAGGDDNAREAAAAIRFHLHNARVDVVDYEPGRESWFEFLPAARPGTLRPALASGSRLLRKGLAAK